MENYLDENYKIFTGLYTALSRTKSSAKLAYNKIIEAQEQYFSNHQNKVDSKKQNLTLELLDDAMHKFYLGAFALEQLWGVTNYLKFPNHGLPEKFNTPLTNQQSEITFVLAAIFDQTLFTWRSFIDYYMKYLLFFLTGDLKNNISIKKFRSTINKHISLHPEDNRVIEVKKYFEETVLSNTLAEGSKSWGDLLKELRDKTAHQKLIKPNLRQRTNNEGFIIQWPTIRGQDYSDLAQMVFENPAYQMLLDLFPILYGFNWIPGPFKKGMFR